jgi:hypothetical protein
MKKLLCSLIGIAGLGALSACVGGTSSGDTPAPSSNYQKSCTTDDGTPDNRMCVEATGCQDMTENSTCSIKLTYHVAAIGDTGISVLLPQDDLKPFKLQMDTCPAPDIRDNECSGTVTYVGGGGSHDLHFNLSNLDSKGVNPASIKVNGK